jgi:hypothetical protein
MRLEAPQIIILVVNVLGIGFAMAKHGEPRNEKYNFFITLIAAIIEIVILSYGGFFN